MRRLLLSVSVLALAGCGSKTAAPAAPAAPAASPAPAPAPTSPAPSAAPAPAPTPAATPAPATETAPAAAPTAEKPATELSADPFGNDMRELEIASRIIDGFLIDADQCAFKIKVTMADGSVPIDEVFALLETEGVDSPMLQSEARPGFYFKTFCLKDEDKARMHAASETLETLKANSTGGNDLTMEATINTRPDPDADPSDLFSLTIYARSHKDTDFVQMGPERIEQQSVSVDPASFISAKIDDYDDQG